MAAEFQDRLLDELMPKKKIKEEPPIVAGVAPAAGLKAAARLSAGLTDAKASAQSDDVQESRGTCAICFDLLPPGDGATLYECCCKSICTACSKKCRQHDNRCPLCRTPAHTSEAEWVRRLQKHADKGNGEAQVMLGDAYRDGYMGLRKSPKRALQLYQLAAAQGHAGGQSHLGSCYESGQGVKINFKTAAQWYRRAAEQGFPHAQCRLAGIFHGGTGVAQSYDEAVKWWGLAAAQDEPDALFYLGACYQNGVGVPQDDGEALRCFKRAAAKGCTDSAEAAKELELHIATTRSG
jgi:hypothetical protein